VGTRLLGEVPYHDLIRRSRLAGKTLFEMEGPGQEECVAPFRNMAEELLHQPRASVPTPMGDREIFTEIGGWK
jgi:light-independent protochlorophyllide reductase subunit L